MRILLYGAGRIGTRVLCQLKKNPSIEVKTMDPRGDDCEAVERGVIDHVDIEETLSPLSVSGIVDAVRPDLVLIATASEDLGLGNAPGLNLLMDALCDEFENTADVPVIEVARRMGAIQQPARDC